MVFLFNLQLILYLRISEGQYTLIVTDNNSCVETKQAHVFVPAEIYLILFSSIQVHCKGTNTGSLIFGLQDVKDSPDSSQNFNCDEYYDFYLINDLLDTVFIMIS